MKMNTMKQRLAETALDVAKQSSIRDLTQKNVTTRMGVSMGLIPYYYGSMAKFRKAVVELAIVENEYEVLVDAIANNYTCFSDLDTITQKHVLSVFTR